MAFSPDKQVVASASYREMVTLASPDRTVRLWNAATGEEIHLFKVSKHIPELEFGMDGKLLKTNVGNFNVSQYVSTLLAGESTIQVSLELGGQWIKHKDQNNL